VAISTGSGPGQVNANINVTPMIDVMLVLLIIFMVVAPLATVSIRLDLPPATPPPPGQHEKPPTFISIQDSGQIFVSFGKTDIRPSSMQALGADLADVASAAALVERTVAELGAIDIVVNNAGITRDNLVMRLKDEDWDAVLNANLRGAFAAIRAASRGMMKRRSGRIINMSSMGGRIYEPLGSWYHATKFAVEGMSDALRLELAPFGIDVVLIEPGGMNTEWGAIAADSLLATSAHTAYAAQATGVARMLRSVDQKPKPSSSPDRIARAVVRAAQARRPKTRYLLGPGAKPLVTLHQFLPDRVFDAILARVFKPVS